MESSDGTPEPLASFILDLPFALIGIVASDSLDRYSASSSFDLAVGTLRGPVMPKLGSSIGGAGVKTPEASLIAGKGTWGLFTWHPTRCGPTAFPVAVAARSALSIQGSLFRMSAVKRQFKPGLHCPIDGRISDLQNQSGGTISSIVAAQTLCIERTGIASGNRLSAKPISPPRFNRFSR